MKVNELIQTMAINGLQDKIIKIYQDSIPPIPIYCNHYKTLEKILIDTELQQFSDYEILQYQDNGYKLEIIIKIESEE